MSADPTVLAIDVLATQRLTRLMTEDTITQPLREKLWVLSPPENKGPGYVATCNHCSSVYAALAVTLSHTRPLRFTRPLIYALALSSVTSLVADYAKKPGGWG